MTGITIACRGVCFVRQIAIRFVQQVQASGGYVRFRLGLALLRVVGKHESQLT
jgi:hypothetical protein